MLKIFLVIFLFTITSFYSQEIMQNKYGTLIRFESEYTSFPHQNRNNGHDYNGKHYNSEEHYRDSSVVLFIPSYFNPKDSVDFVFYFHGWWNNVDSSMTKFNLLEQFYNSKIDAVLILSETTKNAPDSFGGKLEEKNVFKMLVNDILITLENYFSTELVLKNITLSGHSRAYRVIAYILSNGGLANKIKNVFLFDALYGQVERYTNWLNLYNGHFINIYTPNGGTKTNSENLFSYFDEKKIPYKILHDDFSANDLKKSKIIFIKSKLGHSQIIHTKNQFRKFLETTN